LYDVFLLYYGEIEVLFRAGFFDKGETIDPAMILCFFAMFSTFSHTLVTFSADSRSDFKKKSENDEDDKEPNPFLSGDVYLWDIKTIHRISRSAFG